MHLQISLFALLITFNTIDAVKRNSQPKIVIVGAGLSGISAATKLIENGLNNIVILEAENRVGGRIYSTNFSGGIVDLGGQWVHGIKDNIVYEIVNGSYKFGVTGFDDKLPLFLQSNAASVDQLKCENFAHLALDTLFSSYEEMSHFPGSIGDFFNLKFKNSSIYKFPGNQELGDAIIDYYEKEMNVWNGTETWFDLSAQLHTISGYNEGIQYLTWNRDGYKTFFKYLTKQNSTDCKEKPMDVMSKILLNQDVTNIEWKYPRFNNKYALVTTKSGKKYFADHVIVTVSLGVLKNRHKTMFTPQLPLTLQKTINAMGYGNIGKIFLEFDKPFWPNDTNWIGYGFLWTKKDLTSIKGTSREWLLDLQSFSVLDKFPNVIEALLAGPHMRTFETLNSNKVINDCMWLLQKFLGIALPFPKAMIKTEWLTNKNFLGTYSYHSIKAAKLNVTSADLAKTLYNIKSKPLVLFAGEHTDRLFSSNAHGAVNSGHRVANKIVNFYKQRLIVQQINNKLFVDRNYE